MDELNAKNGPSQSKREYRNDKLHADGSDAISRLIY